MFKNAQVLGVASALALIGGAALADEESFDFEGFDSVSTSAGVMAKITVGPDYSVRAESTPKGLEKLRIRLEGSDLMIGRKPNTRSWSKADRVTVYVTLPSLKSLDVSSGSDAEASGVKSSAFTIDASSGAHAVIDGECGALTVDISSGAHVDAERLACESAMADVSSGGHGEIHASKNVTADASSGGHLAVYGSPVNTNFDRSSGGSISVKK